MSSENAEAFFNAQRLDAENNGLQSRITALESENSALKHAVEQHRGLSTVAASASRSAQAEMEDLKAERVGMLSDRARVAKQLAEALETIWALEAAALLNDE